MRIRNIEIKSINKIQNLSQIPAVISLAKRWRNLKWSCILSAFKVHLQKRVCLTRETTLLIFIWSKINKFSVFKAKNQLICLPLRISLRISPREKGMKLTLTRWKRQKLSHCSLDKGLKGCEYNMSLHNWGSTWISFYQEVEWY